MLLVVAYIFYLLAYSMYASFLWYLLDTPLCWSSENVGTYTALSSIACALLTPLGMKFFVYIGADDIQICAVSHVCFALSSLWLAFARHKWQLYAGLLISSYADYPNALILPIMAKWLDVHDRTNAFTLVAEINTIISSFGDSFFNWFYANTVSEHRNMTLLIAAGFSSISLISTV